MIQSPSMNRLLAPLALACALLAGGCSSVSLGKGRKKVVATDYAEGRVVDVIITDRLTGSNELLFLSTPKRSLFLEGYITGVVIDYEENPIPGVVVRAVAEGEEHAEWGKAFRSSAFDPGVSDTNGVYRIRFSLPIVKRAIDIRGRFLYNPGWETEKVNLGKAYKPQMHESPFRLVYDERRGILVFAEGIRKLIVSPARLSEGVAPKQTLPGKAAPAVQEEKKEADEDLFKGFGFGGQ